MKTNLSAMAGAFEFAIAQKEDKYAMKITGQQEREHVDDKIFTYCAAAVVLLMFVNLGTVLDLKRLKLILLRPIGPFIGLCSRYLLMPALGFGLGFLLLRDKQELQLGLLFTAVSPSGGLANICTIFLKGNINLSLTTTTLNSLFALGMLPFWILVVVPHVYKDVSVSVPFLDLAISTVAIILAILFGLTLRLLIPKTMRFIFRYLKPLSLLLSLALVGLTVGLNSFVFKELNLMIAISVFLLPLIGYLLSFGLSKMLCRTSTDSLTIAIETSVLNMTVPILLLNHSLEQSQAEMIMVIPIVATLMSLCLVLIFYITRRACGWNKRTDLDCFDEKAFLIET